MDGHTWLELSTNALLATSSVSRRSINCDVMSMCMCVCMWRQEVRTWLDAVHKSAVGDELRVQPQRPGRQRVAVHRPLRTRLGTHLPGYACLAARAQLLNDCSRCRPACCGLGKPRLGGTACSQHNVAPPATVHDISLCPRLAARTR